jgi:hypothetical protein
MYLGRGPLGAGGMHFLFLFYLFFQFPWFLLVFFRSRFFLVFHVFTGLDFLFEFKKNSISKKYDFRIFVQIQKLFKFKNCSNSKFVQTQIFFKFKFCSNSIFDQIHFLFEFYLLFKIIVLFEFAVVVRTNERCIFYVFFSFFHFFFWFSRFIVFFLFFISFSFFILFLSYNSKYFWNLNIFLIWTFFVWTFFMFEQFLHLNNFKLELFKFEHFYVWTFLNFEQFLNLNFFSNLNIFRIQTISYFQFFLIWFF